MRPIITCCIVSVLMISKIAVQAQTAEQYQKKIDHFESMKNTGTIVALIGIPVSIVGIITYRSGIKNSESSSDAQLNSFIQIPVGVALMVIGGAGIISGLVLTVMGNSKMYEYQKKLENLQLGTYYTPQHAGFTLTYRF